MSTLGTTAADLVTRLGESMVLTEGRQAHVGVSIGVARFPDHGATAVALLAAADAAMYRAKKAGKHQYAMAHALVS